MDSNKRKLMRVPDEVKKCVGFACVNRKDDISLIGTVFFVEVAYYADMRFFCYAVTAKHVIVKALHESVDDKLLVRVNKPDGWEYLTTSISDWRFHPSDSSVDVAVLPIRGRPSADGFDVLSIPTHSAATEENITKSQIGIGDEVFITGLFINHLGKERNLPIIRVGNISLMDDEPVSTKAFGEIEAYLIEARSQGGLSGSPVFVNHGNFRINEKAYTVAPDGTSFLHWLGLVHGHWDADLSKDSGLIAKEIEKVNKGIAIVVPAKKILEVINQKEFAEIREEEIERHKKKLLPIED